MTQNKIIGLPAERPIRDALILKIGGVCTIVGAIAFGTLRVLHGDTPGADPRASLAFVATRPIYAGVHIGAVFAALLTLAGLIALASSLTRPGAWMLGRLGVASSLVGMAIFGVESTSEGLALPELAHASANAPADQQAELARAAKAVLAVTHGPSLVAIALLYGISLVLFGLAVVLDDYPSWLGWAGIVRWRHPGRRHRTIPAARPDARFPDLRRTRVHPRPALVDQFGRRDAAPGTFRSGYLMRTL